MKVKVKFRLAMEVVKGTKSWVRLKANVAEFPDCDCNRAMCRIGIAYISAEVWKRSRGIHFI